MSSSADWHGHSSPGGSSSDPSCSGSPGSPPLGKHLLEALREPGELSLGEELGLSHSGQVLFPFLLVLAFE